jgi:hypothetical protein
MDIGPVAGVSRLRSEMATVLDLQAAFLDA